MNAIRVVVHVVVLTVVHLALTTVIGAVLLSGYAAWQLLTGAAP